MIGITVTWLALSETGLVFMAPPLPISFPVHPFFNFWDPFPAPPLIS